MATFIFSSEDGGVVDPALDLTRHIQTLKGSEVASQIQDKEALELALENLDKILVPMGEKEKDREAIDTIISVICSVFQRVLVHDTAPADSEILVDKFIKKVTSNADAFPSLRLKTLGTVYNVMGGNGSARYNVFHAIITYAAEAGKEHLASVTAHLSNLDAMFTEWKTDVENRRKMYLSIIDGMTRHKNSDGAHEYRLKFLRTFQGAKDQSPAVKHATTAAMEAIANPKVYQFDAYLDLDAVQALQADGTHGKVFELVRIFAHEDLEAFNKFHAQNSAFIDGLGLSKDECVRKMRLLSLCTLAAAKQELRYTDIAACMQVQEAEVEAWVIKAVTARLLDAKMDQISKTVSVNHWTDRTFTPKQWAALRTRLVSWRDGMRRLLHTIDAARQARAQQMQDLQSPAA